MRAGLILGAALERLECRLATLDSNRDSSLGAIAGAFAAFTISAHMSRSWTESCPRSKSSSGGPHVMAAPSFWTGREELFD
jgi:hypothetical protein